MCVAGSHIMYSHKGSVFVDQASTPRLGVLVVREPGLSVEPGRNRVMHMTDKTRRMAKAYKITHATRVRPSGLCVINPYCRG